MTTPLLAQRYDALWQQALAAFAAGQVETDSQLERRLADERRGMTLLIRPAAPVAERVADFLREVAALEPAQHYYRPEELHVTALSLFTATAQWQPFFARQDEYRAAVREALGGIAPFRLVFRGITATPAAVMVQGFPLDEGLELLRERLRQALHTAGLAAGLDQRYRISTAHMTALRFKHQPQNLPRLLDALERRRQSVFGETLVSVLELVDNNWYMSVDRVQLIERHLLVAK
jgi:2'-5' RNA ligase